MATVPGQAPASSFAGLERVTPEGIQGNIQEFETRVQERAGTQTGGAFAGLEKVEFPGQATREIPVDPGEAASAFVRRTTGAVLQTGGAVAGGIAGAQVGLALGAFGGPLAPITVPLGGAIGLTVGAVSGFVAGDALATLGEAHGLSINSINDVPEQVRPYAVAGEVVGGTMAALGAPLALVAQGVRLPISWAGNYINQILNSAGRSPAAFAATEMAAGGSAAIAAGIVQEAYPDSPGTRLVAEIGVGALNPVRLGAGLVRRGGGTVWDFARSMTPAGRRTKAGRDFVDGLLEAGDDPEALMRILAARQADEARVPGVSPSVVQVTGSRAVAEFQAQLAITNAKFGADAARQAGDALEMTTRVIATLRGTGDPRALRIAADMESDQIRTMLSMHIADADRDMQLAARAITNDSPQVRAQLGQTTQDIVDRSLASARKVERKLWSAIPDKTPMGAAGAESLFRRFSKVKREMLEDKKLPELVESTLAKMKDAKNVLRQSLRGEPVAKKTLATANKRLSVGNMLKLRSELLEQARAAAKANQFNDARVFGELSEGILDDLARSGNDVPGTSIDIARKFSRELNDVYTRTFVGKATAVGTRGAELVPPEVLLVRAFATGKEMGALQMRQLEEATRFLSNRGYGTATTMRDMDAMMDVQERIIRLTAAQAVKRDPVTNRVTGLDSNKLRTFMNENADVLDRFPEARQLMDDAINTTAGREAMVAQVTRAREVLNKESAIARILDVENPIDAVRGAIQSKFPEQQLQEMIEVAIKGGPDAVDGLRAAMWEDAFRSATNPGASGLNYQHLISAIDGPIKPGLPSLRQVMRQNGLLTAEENLLTERLIDKVRKIILTEAAAPSGVPIGDEVDTVIDLMLRVTGSRAGVFFAGGQTGPQLIAASRGSAAFRNIFAKAPKLKIQEIYIAALRGDPITPGAPRFSLMISLLEKGATPAAVERSFRQVHAYAIQAGIMYQGKYSIEGERQ